MLQSAMVIEQLELANEAVRLSHGKDPNYLRTLAAACAENGRFVEAEETARRASRAAELLDNRSLVNALRDEIALYELGLPYHQVDFSKPASSHDLQTDFEMQ